MVAGAAVDGFPCAAAAAWHLQLSPRRAAHPSSSRLLVSCGRSPVPARRWSLLASRLCGQDSHCGQLERKMLLGVMRTSASYCQKDISHFYEDQKASSDLEGISKFETMEKDFRSGSSSFDSFKFALLFGLLSFQGCQWALAGESQSLIVTDFGSGVQSFVGDLGDISTGFASAFLLIFFSELGDKTFFIAALLAARNSGAIVFLGTFGALAAMTIVSVALGRTFHYIDGILPFSLGGADLPIDDIAAVCLLTYFGVSTLLDAASTEGLRAEEEQKEAELAVSELLGNGAGIVAAASSVVSTFLLVFVAEWGDKSFFSTIALAAASSPLGVIGGALVGHAVATLIAVLGGSLLGTLFSERVIAYIGGSLFLIFAVLTLIEIIY